jgi:hypothetical protein
MAAGRNDGRFAEDRKRPALLGSGDGLCLDVGCGTGHYFDAIRGVRHLPLAEFLQAIAASGLHIDEVTEPGDAPIPSVLAVAARRIAP